MNPMRNELLEAIQRTSLPVNVGPPDLSSAQMFCLKDMIDDDWIEGYPTLHSSGSGYACIHIVRMKDAGVNALAESMIKKQESPPEKSSTMESRIFVSYARTDQNVVKSIVRFVKAAGFPTWFDHDDLLAGHDWRYVIKKEIERSRLLLLCLSTHSVDRTGFFQKEMRLALEQAELRPQSKVFIMPVRLNACSTPDAISNCHVLDLFTPRATDRLLAAIADATGEGARAPISDHEVLISAVSDYNRDNPV